MFCWCSFSIFLIHTNKGHYMVSHSLSTELFYLQLMQSTKCFWTQSHLADCDVFPINKESFQKRHSDFSVLQLLYSLQFFVFHSFLAVSVYISEMLEGESSPQNSQILPKIRTKICYKAYLKYRILPSKFASSSVLFLD